MSKCSSFQTKTKMADQSIYQKVGKCFLEHADSMRTAYTQYCLNHDKAEQLLEKFDALPEMQKVNRLDSHFLDQ